MQTFSGFLLVSLMASSVAFSESVPNKIVTVEAEYKLPALKYGLNPVLFKAVLIVESDLNHRAVNPITLDFGIGQINYKTAEAYNIDTSRLIHDRAYSIDRAAFVLSQFQKTFKAREPATWVCRYNIGHQNLPARCAEYNRRVKLVMSEF